MCVSAFNAPGVFLDADLFGNREWKDDDEAHEKECKTVICVPMIWHLSFCVSRHRLIQRQTHWNTQTRGYISFCFIVMCIYTFVCYSSSLWNI